MPAAAIVTLAPGAPVSSVDRLAQPLWTGSRSYLVKLPGGATPQALGRLARAPGVVAVEPDRSRSPLAVDPLRARQTHLDGIRWSAPAAGSRRPLVAVLDTGIDSRVPDLAPSLLTAEARSFVPESPDPFSDREGHGTHVAGILAAVTGNGEGGAGVAAAEVLPIKIADRTGNATTSSLVRGIRYAVARGAPIINISFGGPGFSALEQEAVDHAARAGALIVAASGNSGEVGSPKEYPGAYRHVLTVGAAGADGRALPSSTRGPQVAIVAPGDGVVSTAPPPDDFTARSGTSMATAMISGVAARILSRSPDLDASQLRGIILGSARDLPPDGRDLETGVGLVDMRAALAFPAPPPDTPEPNDEPPDAARTPPLLVSTAAAAGSRAVTVRGRVEQWSDPRDGYRVPLRAGEALTATLTGPGDVDLDLVLWRPGTPAVRPGPGFSRRWLAAASIAPGSTERIRLRAPVTGVYTLEVRVGAGSGGYRLTAARGSAKAR